MIDRPSPTAAVALAAPLLLAACASQVTLPPLPDCHPASPNAPTTALAAPSSVLDRPAPIPAAEPAVPEAHDGPMGPGAGGEPTGLHAAHTGHAEETATVYACPMHPEVRSASPGTCPKCGMALEPATPAEGAPDEEATMYACPMHPEVHSASPGTCPKCGMALAPTTPAEGPSGESAEPAHEHGHEDHR